ncbi:hypothetical protein AWU65_07305 [Paenibacillus glucanolyticus]|uniref:Uncharacterized protein n=1 Tax=Paenibacillus glucanolyticus TaxID=59843 RepID=A0A163I026_9BACL|nr:hypothetical protein [Paenibacillus glucanolyticus]KZS45733.1 hypothetical protein AWU65_07305 [Paenibacillus glucanolyticus]
MIDNKPLMRSMMGEQIWKLMRTDPEAFKRETRDYFARGYPGWTVTKVKYPIVFLRDDRGRQT